MPLSRKLCYIIPNAATMSSLVLGIAAIMLLNDQHFLTAAIFILVGAILDVMDGQLAARLNAMTDIGKQLDSLADMVTFGVAPTMLVYHLMLLVGVMQPIAIASSLTFAMAGAFRLARFNTLPSNRSAYFIGMPIPLASLILITGSFWRYWTLNIWWAAIVVVVSYLMISPFPYPKLKHVLAAPPLLWLAVLIYALGCWFAVGWEAVPFSLLLIYAISGPLFAYTEPAQKLMERTLR